MDNIIKFPSAAGRQVHSRKPRRSKYGTPEERAAKLAAGKALVAGTWGRDVDQRSAKASAPDLPFIGFLQKLGAYIVKEFATGKEVDQIFDELVAEALQTGRRT